MSYTTAYLLPGATRLEAREGFYETYKGIIETPDGKVPAYVKLLGEKPLVNELVCAALGQAAKLQIPHSYLVSVSIDDYPDSEFLKGQKLKETIAFGSSDAKCLSLARRFRFNEGMSEEESFDELLNVWDDWREAMIFDEWIANQDRHSGNILLGGENQVWLIDHTHAFSSPTWQREDLRPERYTKNQIALHVERAMTLPERSKLLGLVKATSKEYADIEASNIIDACKASAFVCLEDIDALKAFVTERVKQLPNLLANHVRMPMLSLEDLA